MATVSSFFFIVVLFDIMCYNLTVEVLRNRMLPIRHELQVPDRKSIAVAITMDVHNHYSRGQPMRKMFSIAGRCGKSHRFSAFVIACVVTIIVTVCVCLTINHGLNVIEEALKTSISLGYGDFHLDIP